MSVIYSETLEKFLSPFKPRCIKPGADRDAEMFFAGQVALAEAITARFITSDQEEDEEHVFLAATRT